MEILIDTEEAAKALGIQPVTLYTWVTRRKVAYVKVGDALRFRPSALEGWLREREFSPQQPRQVSAKSQREAA